jgi:DNA-binding CsgD family transcriptional regulator
MAALQPISLNLGHETVRLNVTPAAAGFLIERESFSTAPVGKVGPKITQVLLANDASISEFMKSEPHSDRVGPVLEHLLREAMYVAPESSEPASIEEQLAMLNRLSRATDEIELLYCINAVIRGLGATSFMYFLAQDDSSGQPASYRILTSHAEALQIYVSLRMYAGDPALERARGHPEPFFSSDFGKIQKMNGGGRKIAERARGFGMKSLAVVPAHHRGSNHFGVLYAATDTLPEENGEERLRANQALFRALSAQVFEWYMRKEASTAFRNTGLTPVELQILNAWKRGFQLDAIAEVLNISPTSLKRLHLPSINEKLTTKTIRSSVQVASDLGLLPLVSDRKVAYVLYSPKHGVFLRADGACPAFSKLFPGPTEEAQIFDDIAAANELIDEVMPNQRGELEFRRVDVHCFATSASREECAAAGLPWWEPDADQEDEDAWVERNGPSSSYH